MSATPARPGTVTGVGRFGWTRRRSVRSCSVPKLRTVPSPIRAMACSRPAAMSIAPVMPDTVAGVRWATVVPSPSWPYVFAPQARGVPAGAASAGAVGSVAAMRERDGQRNAPGVRPRQPLALAIGRSSAIRGTGRRTEPAEGRSERSVLPPASRPDYPAATSTMTASKFAVNVLAAVSPIWMRPTGVVPVSAIQSVTSGRRRGRVPSGGRADRSAELHVVPARPS